MAVTRLPRRIFLGAATGAALAATTSWAAPTGPDRKHGKLKIGIASYTLRKFPLDKVIETCKEVGTPYVNFKDFHMPMTDSAEALGVARRKVEAAGLQIMGGGTITLKNDAAQVRKAFEYARDAGFPLMVVAPEPAAFDIIEKNIQEFGIKVAIHNHGPEDSLGFHTPQDAYKHLKGRDKRFGLCIDIGHTVRAGMEPVRAVEECADRLLDLHVKDLKDKKDRDSQTEVGRGALDIPGLFRALTKVGYTGHLGLEYEINAENPFAGVKESFAYMWGVKDSVEG